MLLAASDVFAQQTIVQPPSPRIQIVTQAASPVHGAAIGGMKRTGHVKLSVDAAAPEWTDTHLSVAAGDTLTFAATGEVALAGHALSPDGMTRGWRDMLRHFPVDTSNAGALVGRIGESVAAVPFSVGSAATIQATQSGLLYLRINTSVELPATGKVTVDVKLVPAPAVAKAGSEARGTVPVSKKISDPLPFAALTSQTLDALPHRITDRDGAPGDAINFALFGTEQQVEDAFARAGWVAIDADTGSAILHGLLSTLQHKPYVEVPMSTLYLFGRPQDLSFARASAISVASERHHLRCWKTGTVVNGVPLWVGAVTHDVGFERDQRNGKMTHRIAPEIDLERDFLRDSFQASGTLAAAAYFTPLDPVHTANTATGGSFTTDGRVLLLQLR